MNTIRLSVRLHRSRYAFTLFSDGKTFTTTDPTIMADYMMQLGIDNPLHLIEAARQWGEVSIVVGGEE